MGRGEVGRDEAEMKMETEMTKLRPAGRGILLVHTWTKAGRWDKSAVKRTMDLVVSHANRRHYTSSDGAGGSTWRRIQPSESTVTLLPGGSRVGRVALHLAIPRCPSSAAHTPRMHSVGRISTGRASRTDRSFGPRN